MNPKVVETYAKVLRDQMSNEKGAIDEQKSKEEAKPPSPKRQKLVSPQQSDSKSYLIPTITFWKTTVTETETGKKIERSLWSPNIDDSDEFQNQNWKLAKLDRGVSTFKKPEQELTSLPKSPCSFEECLVPEMNEKEIKNTFEGTEKKDWSYEFRPAIHAFGQPLTMEQAKKVLEKFQWHEKK